MAKNKSKKSKSVTKFFVNKSSCSDDALMQKEIDMQEIFEKERAALLLEFNGLEVDATKISANEYDKWLQQIESFLKKIDLHEKKYQAAYPQFMEKDKKSFDFTKKFISDSIEQQKAIKALESTYRI
jgi:hypothetical protein